MYPDYKGHQLICHVLRRHAGDKRKSFLSVLVNNFYNPGVVNLFVTEIMANCLA